MARYGREYPGEPRGRGRRGMREPEYGRFRRYGGWRRGERPGYAEEMGYAEEYGYAEEMGYGTEAGYGAGLRRGEEGYRYPEAYDYEFGGRGWPYREPARWVRGRGGFRRRGAAGYEEEMVRPGGFGMGYGFEYVRSGEPGYRRARGRRPRPWGAERGRREFRGPERAVPLGYEGEFARPGYGGRVLERGYEEGAISPADYDIEIASRAGMYSGHTPPDRWPDIGHDVDMRPARERQMSDGEIREAVLENLFQDTWIDPEKVRVEVDRGVVTLKGDVNDFLEARYAWDDAWESAGVRGVIDNLTVRTDRPQEEMELPQTAGRRVPRMKRRRRRMQE